MAIDIPDFNRGCVLVTGDLMLDRYWHGDTGRISPEAPVPVVRVETIEERPGGAGNVAVNISALGGRTLLSGLTGRDEAADLLEARLAAAGVTCHLTRLDGHPTITKLRVLSRHQQLLRLDFERGFAQACLAGFEQSFERLVAEADVVVLSDYGKGTLARIEALIDAARRLGRPVLIDPKGADFRRYRGATLLTPNQAEFEAVAGPCADDAVLCERGERLRIDLGLEALLITRSSRGMTLIQAGRAPRHLSARAREVYDVTGAGDTVIAVLAAALASGAGLDQATHLANLAAGIVVGKLGAAAASRDELQEAGDDTGSRASGAVDEGRLLRLVAAARANGERIVMTNGCFDLLHAGHVTYLAEARALGDRLIVAVNDDGSVARLKGGGRPINPLADRMQVLAALSSVDWVVPFSEDTPERLICRILPDVLVKGGDYRPDEIAGSRCVTAAGGEVRVLGYVAGRSTTGLIDRLRADPRGGTTTGASG